jgi:hypothetical protein
MPWAPWVEQHEGGCRIWHMGGWENRRDPVYTRAWEVGEEDSARTHDELVNGLAGKDERDD